MISEGTIPCPVPSRRKNPIFCIELTAALFRACFQKTRARWHPPPSGILFPGDTWKYTNNKKENTFYPARKNSTFQNTLHVLIGQGKSTPVALPAANKMKRKRKAGGKPSFSATLSEKRQGGNKSETFINVLNMVLGVLKRFLNVF